MDGSCPAAILRRRFWVMPDARAPAMIAFGLLQRRIPPLNKRFMSLISRLRDFFRRPVDGRKPPESDEHLTVAALLTLVANADGRMLKVEEDGLRVLLGSRFGLTDDQTERLLAQVGDIRAALDPSTTLVDRILHDVRYEERPRLLALAYRIAAIDGTVHEFEDDLIWRTGRLLDISERDLATIKARALKNIVPDQADP